MTTYIKEEKKIIEEDFHKCYYYLIAMEGLLKNLGLKMLQTTQKAKDYQAVKYTNKLNAQIQNLSFALEQFKEAFKVDDRKQREEFIKIMQERIELVIIPLVRMSIDEEADFINMISSFFQKDYASVHTEILDTILELEEPSSIEGLSLISRYCPDLSVEKKEEFAKDMTKWANFRNQILNKN